MNKYGMERWEKKSSKCVLWREAELETQRTMASDIKEDCGQEWSMFVAQED